MQVYEMRVLIEKAKTEDVFISNKHEKAVYRMSKCPQAPVPYENANSPKYWISMTKTHGGNWQRTSIRSLLAASEHFRVATLEEYIKYQTETLESQIDSYKSGLAHWKKSLREVKKMKKAECKA